MTRDNIDIDIPMVDNSRGVSPVIGVILMVAITIILAAVIGAFVLGFGADTETAPTASFSADQDNNPFLDESNGDNTGDAWEVTFSHEGGSSVDGDNIAVAFPDTDNLERDETVADGETIRAGDAVTADLEDNFEDDAQDIVVSDGDRAQLVWESGDTTSVLRTYNINTDGDEITIDGTG